MARPAISKIAKLCSQREAEREKGGKRGRAERFEANSMSGGLAPQRKHFAPSQRR